MTDNGHGIAITIDGLDAGYGKLTILHAIDLHFAPGAFIAILGPNGSGKSTLLKSILGLTTVQRGSIAVDGRSLSGLATEDIAARGLAYVPQRHNVFASMRVSDNLKLAARRLNRQERSAALAEVGARFPILDKRGGQRAGLLSGGERQILAIAIASLSRPRAMLLDEPSAGLAPLIAAAVFTTLRGFTPLLTVIVVEQNARAILPYADHVVFLREGRIAAAMTGDAVRADAAAILERYLSPTMG